ncbi:MAG: LamG-like jellyroll fold domain-containing protein [Candidatus Kapaibacterium sp.]
MDNSNYTPSELIDLALDCELDSNQTTSLFELLARDTALQEEFRQAVAIRRALTNDVLAGVPTIEFTQALFQRAGVEMPGDMTPTVLIRSGFKWSTLATTAFVFLGIGIAAALGINRITSAESAGYQPLALPKLYSMNIQPSADGSYYYSKQLNTETDYTLSPFHTPTYHHNQKQSKGPTDSVTIMPENNGAELSVGLSSEKDFDKTTLPRHKEFKFYEHTEIQANKSISSNIYGLDVVTPYINKKIPENIGSRLPIPAIDYSFIRGNSALSNLVNMGAEIPPTLGTKNIMVSDSKYALEFNGVNDHIVIENVPKSIGVNSTTTAWVYKITEAVNQQWIVGMGARQSLVVQKDGRVAMTNYLAKGRIGDNLDTGYWCSVSDPEKIQLNTWVHYAGVVETDSKKTILKLYRNGKLVNQQSFDYTVNGNPGCDGFIGGVQIGYKTSECYFTYPQSFIGQIDEISLWSRALTQIEISNIMQRKLDVDEDGLIGYWPFEEGGGILSKDKSKYSNHASLQYGASWVKLH